MPDVLKDYTCEIEHAAQMVYQGFGGFKCVHDLAAEIRSLRPLAEIARLAITHHKAYAEVGGAWNDHCRGLDNEAELDRTRDVESQAEDKLADAIDAYLETQG